MIARLWGEKFAKATGQPVVIENRPGASTIIAAQAVASSRTDGYTVLYTFNTTFSINPFVFKKLPYTADDFIPIVRLLSVPYALVVSAESKFRTLQDLIKEARAKPSALTYSSPGIGC